MIDLQPSFPIDDNSNSSAKIEFIDNHSPAIDESSSSPARLRTEDGLVQEEDAARSQTQPVPPIRSLTTRRGFQFPSFESLRSHHFSRAHANNETPIKRQASTEFRASIAKLESLLQEAAHLAERVTLHGQEAGDTNPNKEKEEVQKHLQGGQLKARLQNYDDREQRVIKPPKPPTKDVTSLTPIDPSIAPPVVSLPVSRSVEDELWKDTASRTASTQAVPGATEDDALSPDKQGPAIGSPIEPTRTISPRASLSHIRPTFLHPDVGPRSSSLRTRQPLRVPTLMVNGVEFNNTNVVENKPSVNQLLPRIRLGHERHYSNIFGLPSRQVSINLNHSTDTTGHPKIDLRRKSYVDVYNKPANFDVHQSCNHATIARNWPTSRKRFTAVIACMNTACIGLVLGIYAGEVPAIQYAIADLHHYTILGNVLMYTGMAVTGLVLWPLPLLHGRKPYVVAAQLFALVLQLPQGLAVDEWRDPSQPAFRCLLLVSRAVSGLAFGLADMNIKATLLDCFGASLQSRSSKSSKDDMYDVRHHGGGMGMWLGFAAWSIVGPISVGFMIGASIVSSGVSVAWGFWVSFCIIMFMLLINIIMPEVRRSAFRRTISELTGNAGDFGRVTRGEIKMHLTSTGPYWWGDEVMAGLQLSWRMFKQPGFLVLSIYAAWTYAQYNLILMLLGALASKHYRYTPVYVGLCAFAPAFGAILAAPFQRASYCSRARKTPQRTDSFTIKETISWSSHFVRRLLFMILLPLSAGAYAASSLGPPLTIAAPCMMAGLVGFITTMATAECYGLIMETFDTTDLQPGMTGRPIRGSVAARDASQRTNFSCYPRVMAGFAVTQTLSYVFAAAATEVCGRVERREGTVWATTVVAAASFVLTLLLTAVLYKWKNVQMLPDGPHTFEQLKRVSTSWRPVFLGQGSSKYRKLSILEMGRLTRYSEIRHRNRLESSLSGGVRR